MDEKTKNRAILKMCGLTIGKCAKLMAIDKSTMKNLIDCKIDASEYQKFMFAEITGVALATKEVEII